MNVAMANVLPVETSVRSLAEPLLSTIGNTPLIRLAKIPGEFPGHRDPRQGRIFQPRRLRQRSRGATTWCSTASAPAS